MQGGRGGCWHRGCGEWVEPPLVGRMGRAEGCLLSPLCPSDSPPHQWEDEQVAGSHVLAHGRLHKLHSLAWPVLAEGSGVRQGLAPLENSSPGHCHVPRLTTPGPQGVQHLPGTALTSCDTSLPWAQLDTVLPESHLHLLLLAQQALQPLQVLLTLHRSKATLCLGSVVGQCLGSASKGLQAWGNLCHLDGQCGRKRDEPWHRTPMPPLTIWPQPTPAWGHSATCLQKGREH